MSSDRKLTVKRLVIFYIIAWTPMWIITAAANKAAGCYIYTRDTDDPLVSAVGLCMFFPAIANVLTRLITKEGFGKTYLDINFRGNGKYYLASVLVKLAESAVQALLMWKFFFGDLKFGEMFTAGEDGIGIAGLLLTTAFSIGIFLPAFGEEFGWRGYMMPKLLEIMPKPAALTVGGILWGLWHAPLTMSGHNFGVDYPGFPYVGILVMCLYCTLVNCLFTLLTERTGSVYPASFCHMVNNNVSAMMILSIFATEQAAEAMEKLTDISALNTAWRAMLPVSAVIGIVSFLLFVLKPRGAAAAVRE